MLFAEQLVKELIAIGLTDAEVDNNGYVMATLPANTDKVLPTIGFIAHMDTSPDMSGHNVQPRIVEKYDGKDIVLCEEDNIVLKTEDFPEILGYVGDDIIVTNGKTLLGADDKAGIAEIMSAMEFLIANPDIKHGKIRVAFTPDEEIGQGADHFDVKKFGADFGYTMDGSDQGIIEFENFNAALAKVTFKGRNVHPGYAKHKMVNALRVANQYAIMLPRWETPEHTEGYEGFYHLVGCEGSVEKTTLTYIIRDHDRDRFERRKKEFAHLVNKINKEFADCASLEIRDQYYNMREMIEPVMHIIDLAKEAISNCGMEPKVEPIRGGTDGARLSFMGLPSPNLSAGGMNFHGRFEYISVQAMQNAVNVIVEIAKLVANK